MEATGLEQEILSLIASLKAENERLRAQNDEDFERGADIHIETRKELRAANTTIIELREAWKVILEHGDLDIIPFDFDDPEAKEFSDAMNTMNTLLDSVRGKT